jgi:hypothetical protein
MPRSLPIGKTLQARAIRDARREKKKCTSKKTFDGQRKYVEVSRNTWIDVTDKTPDQIETVKQRFSKLLSVENVVRSLRSITGKDLNIFA